MRSYGFESGGNPSVSRSFASMNSVWVRSPLCSSMACHSSSESCKRRGRLGVLYTTGRPILARFAMLENYLTVDFHCDLLAVLLNASLEGVFRVGGCVVELAVDVDLVDFHVLFLFMSQIIFRVPLWYSLTITYIYKYVKRIMANLGSFLETDKNSLEVVHV